MKFHVPIVAVNYARTPPEAHNFVMASVPLHLRLVLARGRHERPDALYGFLLRMPQEMTMELVPLLWGDRAVTIEDGRRAFLSTPGAFPYHRFVADMLSGASEHPCIGAYLGQLFQDTFGGAAPLYNVSVATRILRESRQVPLTLWRWLTYPRGSSFEEFESVMRSYAVQARPGPCVPEVVALRCVPASFKSEGDLRSLAMLRVAGGSVTHVAVMREEDAPGLVFVRYWWMGYWLGLRIVTETVCDGGIVRLELERGAVLQMSARRQDSGAPSPAAVRSETHLPPVAPFAAMYVAKWPEVDGAVDKANSWHGRVRHRANFEAVVMYVTIRYTRLDPIIDVYRPHDPSASHNSLLTSDLEDASHAARDDGVRCAIKTNREHIYQAAMLRELSLILRAVTQPSFRRGARAVAQPSFCGGSALDPCSKLGQVLRECQGILHRRIKELGGRRAQIGEAARVLEDMAKSIQSSLPHPIARVQYLFVRVVGHRLVAGVSSAADLEEECTRLGQRLREALRELSKSDPAVLRFVLPFTEPDAVRVAPVPVTKFERTVLAGDGWSEPRAFAPAAPPDGVPIPEDAAGRYLLSTRRPSPLLAEVCPPRGDGVVLVGRVRVDENIFAPGGGDREAGWNNALTHLAHFLPVAADNPHMMVVADACSTYLTVMDMTAMEESNAASMGAPLLPRTTEVTYETTAVLAPPRPRHDLCVVWDDRVDKKFGTLMKRMNMISDYDRVLHGKATPLRALHEFKIRDGRKAALVPYLRERSALPGAQLAYTHRADRAVEAIEGGDLRIRLARDAGRVPMTGIPDEVADVGMLRAMADHEGVSTLSLADMAPLLGDLLAHGGRISEQFSAYDLDKGDRRVSTFISWGFRVWHCLCGESMMTELGHWDAAAPLVLQSLMHPVLFNVCRGQLWRVDPGAPCVIRRPARALGDLTTLPRPTCSRKRMRNALVAEDDAEVLARRSMFVPRDVLRNKADDERRMLESAYWAFVSPLTHDDGCTVMVNGHHASTVRSAARSILDMLSPTSTMQTRGIKRNGKSAEGKRCLTSAVDRGVPPDVPWVAHCIADVRRHETMREHCELFPLTKLSACLIDLRHDGLALATLPVVPESRVARTEFNPDLFFTYSFIEGSRGVLAAQLGPFLVHHLQARSLRTSVLIAEGGDPLRSCDALLKYMILLLEQTGAGRVVPFMGVEGRVDACPPPADHIRPATIIDTYTTVGDVDGAAYTTVGDMDGAAYTAVGGAFDTMAA